MDSAFLESGYEGQLITLRIKDNNKTILSIAADIVDKEDESNYTQLLRDGMKSLAFADTRQSQGFTSLSCGVLPGGRDV